MAATDGVPGRESGLASGLLTTAQQVGGSLGLAILSGIASSATATAFAMNGDRTLSMLDGFHKAFYAGMVFAGIASRIALGSALPSPAIPNAVP